MDDAPHTAPGRIPWQFIAEFTDAISGQVMETMSLASTIPIEELNGMARIYAGVLADMNGTKVLITTNNNEKFQINPLKP